MGQLAHWHKLGDEPSTFTDPPLCCSSKMASVLDGEIDAAVHTERQRIVNGALDRLDAYAADSAELIRDLGIDAEQLRIFNLAVERCRAFVLAAGCICPRIEVTGLGETKPRYLPGLDARCGVHRVKEPTR